MMRFPPPGTPAHGASRHTDRTRALNLVFVSPTGTGLGRVAAPGYDGGTIGSFGTNAVLHVPVADGTSSATYFAPVVCTQDFVSGMTMCLAFTSSAAGNNVGMNH